MSASRCAVPVLALVLALAGGCTLGPPPGFSGGDSWSFPLVGPLEDGPLIVPVKVHGRGPYLFVIDTDAPISSIDAALDSELELYSRIGGEYLDESDTGRRMRYAEVLRLEIGTLTVRNRRVWVHKVGTFNLAGRQIRGVIGRDILADSLVFGFDRDLGMGYLATQKGFTAPAGASRFGYRLLKHGVGSGEYRHLVDARVDGKSLRLHLDLGEVASQVREELWPRVGLQPVPLKRALIDEAGTVRLVDTGAHAGRVEVAGVAADNVLVVPYGDRRWRDTEIDGTLGLGFFRGYTVWSNFDDHTITVVPRTTADVSRDRFARWGWEALAGCADAGCARAEVLEEPVEEGARPSPPLLLVERDASTLDVPLEVLLEPRGSVGPSPLPRIVASFPPGSQRVTQVLAEDYRGVTFAVADISPYPRGCSSDKPCAYKLP